MVATKITNLINVHTADANGTPVRAGGFSESWYSDLAADSATLTTRWQQLLIARANLLPNNSAIVGQRIQTVEPALGASRGFDTQYPGTTGLQNDLPAVALQFTMRSTNTANQRQVILRGVPDARIVNGEYLGSAAFTAALQTYAGLLRDHWKFRAIDRTVLPVKVISITDTGVLTTERPHGLVAGDLAQFMSIRYGDGQKASPIIRVATAPTTTTATLNMPHELVGIAFHGGKVRKYGIVYLAMTFFASELTHPRAITRKVGKSFFQFVGRQSRKR